ncbi:MAG: co-chaperone GroES [bacterium]|nr:co-chaperone GroES [bacterium]
MNLKPLSNRVVLKVVHTEEVSEGGIYMPEEARERPQQGIVVASGPGKHTIYGSILKMSVNIGDTVLYGKYTGTEIAGEDGSYLMMSEDDILGIVQYNEEEVNAE